MTIQRKPRIAVVGAGALGGFYGCRLAAAGHDVSFVVRHAHLGPLRHEGLRIIGASEAHVTKIQATDDPGEVGPVDFVLLAVKTNHLSEALPSLAPLIRPSTGVITLQNGVEIPHVVAAALGEDHVMPGMVQVMAALETRGVVRHVGGPGALGFSEFAGGESERARGFGSVLEDAKIEVLKFPSIWSALWSKFMVIVPIGTLGAATGGLELEKLRSTPGLRALVLDTMSEIHETALALGIKLPPDALARAESMMDKQPGHITTSLQRDILSQNPSELDAWTGSAVRLAERAGVPAPKLGLMLELLKAREPAASQ